MTKYSYHSNILFPTEFLRGTNRNQGYSAKIIFLLTKFINKLCLLGLHFLKNHPSTKIPFCLLKITEAQLFFLFSPSWFRPTLFYFLFFSFLNIFIDYAITVVPFPPHSTPSYPPPSLPHSPPIVHVHGSYL